MWGVLTDFWDLISEQIVGGVTYTVAWFQQIGYAVTGAIGGLFDFTIHALQDFMCAFGYIAFMLQGVFRAILAPIIFVFNFTKTFITTALGTPTYNSTLQDFVASAEAARDTIPFWGTLSLAIFLIFGIVGAITLIKMLQKL